MTTGVTDGTAFVELSGVSKHFDTLAVLRDVDLSVAPTHEVETLRDLPAIVG